MAANGLAQMTRLIEFWLKEAPADDPAAFAYQAAEAEWMEKRYFETLGKVVGGR